MGSRSVLCDAMIPASKAKCSSHRFTKGAKRWSFLDFKYIQISERIQIGQMSVTRNGRKLHQFQVWDRKTKRIHANVLSRATSSAAKRFLLELIEKTPFKIKSIQVDGGSEFMGQLEQARAERNIELPIFPPARPKYNGSVGRTNRTFREEFYYYYDFTADIIDEIRRKLEKAVEKYNTFRQHKNFGGLTPIQYIQNIKAESHSVRTHIKLLTLEEFLL